jgi:hypothetical protein
LKNFDGSVRPSDMIFDTLDVWVRVRDLSHGYDESCVW